MKENNLNIIYKTLYNKYGPQNWWPGDSVTEIIIGAVLVQNTNWGNVEMALDNLKFAQALDFQIINGMPSDQLAEMIRPAGYYNIKAKRLKNLTRWIMEQTEGDLEILRNYSLNSLREKLLEINGIGRETADCILLYAFGMPSFVVDTYTARVLSRHKLIEPEADYEQIREYCISHLESDIQLYNEFHALLVQVGKDHCKPKAKCKGCPLEELDHQIEEFY
ncbi:MAG: hypothetical protein JW745_02695 [Sedimentisphaerales bacterium]|nr:hypothetical protein [Sedimentisphaerales bacterium]MBN2843506.1 hypothetical protein [Sedimentisphaerales bacterium]